MTARRTININSGADFTGVMYIRKNVLGNTWNAAYTIFAYNDEAEVAGAVTRANKAQTLKREYLCVLRRNGDPYNTVLTLVPWREVDGVEKAARNPDGVS